MKSVDISVSAGVTGQALPHFWNVCVGAGRANEGLRANWLEHLEMAQTMCDFQYCRFHGLFHDDMFVMREQNGQYIYNFQYIDELFDNMLDRGVRPFVELGFCPECIATDKKTVMWWGGNGSAPTDYSLWADLVDHFVRHFIARYGINEVLTWYFECWNEPNLDPFFTGTKSQYFELYKSTVIAIKGIDARLKVGGPATSNFVPDGRFDGESEEVKEQKTHFIDDLDSLEFKAVWLEDFVTYCVSNNLPVDFISTHPYPTDFALDGHGVCIGRSRSVNSTRDDLQWLRKFVDSSPYPQAEIHLTEWSSSPSSRDFSHDYLPTATFIVKTNLDSRRLVDSLSYWVFTDVFEEGGAGDTIFHGGFGMINFQGIAKPAFHAYRFLAELGDEEIAAEDGIFVSRFSGDGSITAILYNYPQEYPKAVAMTKNHEEAMSVMNCGTPARRILNMTDLTPGAQFVIEMIDKDNGFALQTWREMGSPEPPTRQQTMLLRESAMMLKRTIVTADANGCLTIDMVLDAWNVVCVSEVR